MVKAWKRYRLKNGRFATPRKGRKCEKAKSPSTKTIRRRCK